MKGWPVFALLAVIAALVLAQAYSAATYAAKLHSAEAAHAQGS
jgi:hypothetical protein